MNVLRICLCGEVNMGPLLYRQGFGHESLLRLFPQAFRGLLINLSTIVCLIMARSDLRQESDSRNGEKPFESLPQRSLSGFPKVSVPLAPCGESPNFGNDSKRVVGLPWGQKPSALYKLGLRGIVLDTVATP